MNENELYAQEYEYDNPLITDIDSLKDSCFRECHNIYFHNFKYESI